MKRLGKFLALFGIGALGGALLAAANRYASEGNRHERARERIETIDGGVSRNVEPVDNEHVPSRNERPRASGAQAEAVLVEESSRSAAEGQSPFRLPGPEPPGIEERIREFESEPRDPAWATYTEGRLLSEFSKLTATLIDWQVQCRTSACIVTFVYPSGMEAKAAVRQQQTFAYDLDLLSGPSSLYFGEAGTLVHLMDLHRRCGPDWKCLE